MDPLQLLPLLLVVIAAAATALSWGAKKVAEFLWRPVHLRRLLRMQGLEGPRPKFLVGNMDEITRMKETAFHQPMEIGDHNLLQRICPYYLEWSKLYGRTFVFWWGTEPRITVTRPDMIKEILYTKAAHFGKSALQRKGGAVLLGNGLIMANGSDWAHRRAIVCRAFKMDKIKEMVPSMLESTKNLIRRWDAHLELNGGAPCEVDAYRDLAVVTADIIATTAFGSSYSDGIKLFHTLTSIQKLFVQSNKYLWLPGSRLLPTRTNRKIRKLQREMQALLQDLIKARLSSPSLGTDLLALMLSAVEEDPGNKVQSSKFKFTIQQLIEECQTFFFVGHETTLMLVTWAMMLLCLHPEWQDLARKEARQVLQESNRVVNADTLAKLKTVGMIINETLRLYPPAPNLVRAALQDTCVGDLYVPKGTTFWIPILALHQDKHLWGEDAHEFRPQRFSQGVSRACKTYDFLPFSSGPRICVGQSFAIMEAKLILAMILQHYHLGLSPRYKHSPVSSVTLKPGLGMQLMIKRCD
ncbi:hypothetical protein SELMODRAFT_416039 [Selaginella moellendorffii]|uniref:Uncharacterized protein n=1 Tax=Selaginella moellendorffii TaxID=88036 RepID=D8RXW0_SELML|nr:cytokinin hydroxylase [Selaginella moellendorffii]EFJ22986.1 hypothetical protein SELMODRAFT_416039 [Selaginella moellendorffii]|eukprot:XP_002976081.1 cytokinin hydroxylase [Selaginella moellendorffii]